MMDDDPLMSPAEVRELLGDSFDTVCAGGRCCPLSVDGQTKYLRSLVLRGWRMYGGTEGPAPGPVVRKGSGRGREVSPAVAAAWLEFRRLVRDKFGV
jgi:hypothetical protein